MPAQAGIQAAVGWNEQNLDSRCRGKDEKERVDLESGQSESPGL